MNLPFSTDKNWKNHSISYNVSFKNPSSAVFMKTICRLAYVDGFWAFNLASIPLLTIIMESKNQLSLELWLQLLIHTGPIAAMEAKGRYLNATHPLLNPSDSINSSADDTIV